MAIFNRQVRCTREQLADHYPKKTSGLTLMLKYLYGIIRVLCIIVENLYCISSYLFLTWIVLLPINWLKGDLYSKLENYLYNSLIFIVSSWSLAAGATIIEAGDEYKNLIEHPEKRAEEQQNLSTNGQKSKATKIQQRPKLDGISDTDTNGIIRDSSVNINGINSTTTNGFKEDSSEQYKTVSIKNEGRRSIGNNPRLKTMKHKLVNGHSVADGGDDDESSLNENGFEQIEYQVEIASAAGERKLMHRRFKMDVSKGPPKSTATNQRTCNKKHSSELITSCYKINGVKTQHEHKQDLRTSPICTTLSPSLDHPKDSQAKPRILLLCNHISTADVPLIMQSFSSLTNQSVLWVLDAQFKPTNFGIVCSSHGDFFISKNSFVDGSLREQVLKYPDRNLMVLFPEGGFLRKRIDGSNRYATKNGYPLTTYVTHPRFGAFRDLIDPSVGVTHIVDATLLYDNIKNPLSILDIVLGTRREPAILHYKLYKRSEIIPTEEWLRNIWLEKDKLLAKYYEDRSDLLKRIENTLRTVRLDWIKLLAVHLFYLLVCYLTIFRLFSATSITMLKARELYYSNM